MPRDDQEWFTFATTTIFIDSPGFDPALGPERDILEKFLGNLKILQFIYSMSDQTLFFIPATQLNLVASQLAMLELSVMYSIHGSGYMKQLLKDSSSNQSWLPSVAELKGLFARKLQHEEPGFSYKGTPIALMRTGNSVWDRVKFVMSKIDEVLSNGGRLDAQYFELGRLLGRHLTHMEPPTFSQCAAIGLPGHTRPGPKKAQEAGRLSGDLDHLMEALRTRSATSSFETRMTEALLECGVAIQLAVSGSWGAQWYSSDLALVKAIIRRLERRLSASNV